MAKRISVINFKGGVGKTTLGFNLAAGLSRYHDARVLLVDGITSRERHSVRVE